MHLYEFFCLPTSLSRNVCVFCLPWSEHSLGGVTGWCLHSAALDLLGSEAVGSWCNTALLFSRPLNLPRRPAERYHTHAHTPGGRRWDHGQNTQPAVGHKSSTTRTQTCTGLHTPFCTPTHSHTPRAMQGSLWIVRLFHSQQTSKKQRAILLYHTLPRATNSS